MMNVGIIFYAARATGDADLLRIATEHCLTTRRHLVRGDGSTAHEGDLRPRDGRVPAQRTHQGWRGDSSWARGLAWALYGFGTAYRLHRRRALPRHRRALRRLLHRATPATPSCRPTTGRSRIRVVPTRAPRRRSPPAACWQLAEPDRRRGPSRDAIATTRSPILRTLLTRVPGGRRRPAWEGILKHGVYHERRGLGVDESVMWGDYFFVEALDRVLELTRDGRS